MQGWAPPVESRWIVRIPAPQVKSGLETGGEGGGKGGVVGDAEAEPGEG